jgi:hypothetical protein
VGTGDTGSARQHHQALRASVSKGSGVGRGERWAAWCLQNLLAHGTVMTMSRHRNDEAWMLPSRQWPEC